MALSFSQVSHESTGFYEIGKVQFLSRFLHLGLYLHKTYANDPCGLGSSIIILPDNHDAYPDVIILSSLP
jgi:hypothetical protein